MLKSTLYQCFKRQLKTLTCFDPLWSILRECWTCLTKITCDIFVCVVGVWQRDFLDCDTKRNVEFVRYISKIANLDNNWWSGYVHTHHRVSPDPLLQLLSKLAILELYRTNLTFLSVLQSKKSRCQTSTTHTKISQVISIKHVQHSLRMDHKGSETCRSF